MKTINFFSVFLGIILMVNMTSCAPSTKESFATQTPIITATPIAESDNIDITQVVHAIYKENPECKSYNAMNAEQDVLEFFDATNQMNFDRLTVQEIADSLHNKYRAYLVIDPTLLLSNCEIGCFPERIYIKDSSNGKIREINWNGYLPRRITYKLGWIGDDKLAFQQNINPYNSETVVIDIEQQIIVYRSIESCN